MRKSLIAIAAAGVLVLAGGFALAHMHDTGRPQSPGASMMHAQGMHHGGPQGGPMMHPGIGSQHGGAAMPQGDRSPSSLAYQGVVDKMHTAMNITYTGDADVDFVKGMIPHHEGAVEMAKVVLAFGKNGEVKKLAEEIIKAQEQEIAWMKAWLQKNAK